MKLAPGNLENHHVRLEVLQQAHKIPLQRAVHADEQIWLTLYPYSMFGEHFDEFWSRIQTEQSDRHSIPFAVIREHSCVGITCFLEINEADKSVNVGETYYRPDVRGSIVNIAAKFLLLENAFTSGFTRVQFRVDELNERSRAAMIKLGAVQEGVLRKDKITWTGRVRNTVIFSILEEDWPSVSERLRKRLDEQVQSN